MTSEELDIAFKEAVEMVNSHMEPFPADFLLRLYAYYKKATNDYGQPSSKKSHH
jgi:acyl-CoA-binding protein